MKSEKVNAYSRSECSMCIESLNDRQCNHKLVSIRIGRRHLIYSSHFMCIRTHIPNIPGARTKRRKTIWFFFRIVFLPIPYLCLCGRDDTLHRNKNIRFYFPVKDLMSPVSYLLPISETPNTRPMENWEEPKLKQSIEKKKKRRKRWTLFFKILSCCCLDFVVKLEIGVDRLLNLLSFFTAAMIDMEVWHNTYRILNCLVQA